MNSDPNSDPVIIGGGHNGLAAAFYLAKAGLKPLVLERGAQVGGGAITGEICPGFHGPTLSHEVFLHDRIFAEMDLRRHGVELLASDADVCAVSPDRPPLVLWNQRHYARTADGLRARHPRDGDAYLTFRDAIDHAVSRAGVRHGLAAAGHRQPERRATCGSC